MKKYAINGRFVVRNITGQERFAIEITRELDNLVKPGEIELIIPQYAKEERIPSYKNIKIVKYGNVKSHLWEQISFFFYLLKTRRTGISFCTTCPLLKPDINTMHDINQNVNPYLFKSLYGRLSTIWHSMMLYSSLYFGKKLLTVSEFSKKEIITHFKVNPDKIIVLGNGWQHITRTSIDDSLFLKYPQLKDKQYYFAASSLTPQKNFDWIVNAATKNPKELFAIAGKKEKLSNEFISQIPSNLLFLGYVTDEQMRSLMQHCKAFIHPAVYEGFGIPPMEALANGAQIIISNAACLPEIFEDAAHYINPYNSNVDLNKLLEVPVAPALKILNKYSWEKEAKKLYSLLENL